MVDSLTKLLYLLIHKDWDRSPAITVACVDTLRVFIASGDCIGPIISSKFQGADAFSIFTEKFYLEYITTVIDTADDFDEALLKIFVKYDFPASIEPVSEFPRNPYPSWFEEVKELRERCYHYPLPKFNRTISDGLIACLSDDEPETVFTQPRYILAFSSRESVSSYLTWLYRRGLPLETLQSAFLLILRLRKLNSICVYEGNWRCLFIIACIVTEKITNDNAKSISEFCRTSPIRIDKDELKILEAIFVKLLNWNVSVCLLEFNEMLTQNREDALKKLIDLV